MSSKENFEKFKSSLPKNSYAIIIKDSENSLSEFMAYDTTDENKVKKVLDKGALVCFYMAEWTESLEKLKKNSRKIFNFALEESGALFDTYPPKDIKRYKP